MLPLLPLLVFAFFLVRHFLGNKMANVCLQSIREASGPKKYATHRKNHYDGYNKRSSSCHCDKDKRSEQVHRGVFGGWVGVALTDRSGLAAANKRLNSGPVDEDTRQMDNGQVEPGIQIRKFRNARPRRGEKQS